MTDLPTDWHWTTLGAILERIEAGKSFAGEPRPARANEWGIIKVSAMTYGTFREDENKAVPADTAFPPDAEIRPGDLLVSRANTRDYVGASVLVTTTRPRLLLSDKSLRLVPKPDVDRRWLWYALLAPQARRYMSDASTGVKAGMRNISQEGLRSLPVPLPPIEDQLRIVELLEEHLSRLDAAQHYVDSAARNVESLTQVWLSRHKLLVKAPEAALGELLAVGLSNGRSVQTRDGGFPVLRLTALNEARPFLVSPGDLLVSRGNGSRRLVGRAGLVVDGQPAVAYPDTLIRIRVQADRMQPAFLALVWNSPAVRTQIEGMAKTTAGIYKINQQDLRSVRLPVPSLLEQSQVVAEADELRVSHARLHATVKQARVRSAGLRRALLAAAFAGRLTERTNAVVEELVGG